MTPETTAAALRELWRREMYPHVEPDVFERFFADLTASGWDDIRVEVAAVERIIAALSLSASRWDALRELSAKWRQNASYLSDHAVNEPAAMEHAYVWRRAADELDAALAEATGAQAVSRGDYRVGGQDAPGDDRQAATAPESDERGDEAHGDDVPSVPTSADSATNRAGVRERADLSVLPTRVVTGAQLAAATGELKPSHARETAFKAGYHCRWRRDLNAYCFDPAMSPGDPDGAYAAWLQSEATGAPQPTLNAEQIRQMRAQIERLQATIESYQRGSSEATGATKDTPSANTKCDGNHGGPRCADPECWNQ